MKLSVRQIPRPFRGRLFGLAATLLITIAARIFYRYVVGIRFDTSGLVSYCQFVDPELLRHHLLQSILYLREQPPLFNLFLGVVLKLAPELYGLLFHASYLIAGIVLAASLFWLLTSFEVPVWAAATVTSLFMIHPTTIIYENWLLYEYPLTLFLSIAAVALYYFVARGTIWIGHAFFWTVAVIVLTRGTFHLVWLLLVIGGVALLPSVRWRTLIRCSLLPLCVVSAFYVKHYVLFGEFVSGEVYRKLNYSMMRTATLPYEELLKLVEEGKVSPVSILPVYRRPVTRYAPFLPPFQDTGIPILDEVEKKPGICNWHHYAMPRVADLYFRDAKVIDSLHPELYWRDLPAHVQWYFRPADETLALCDPPTENMKRAAPLILWANRLTAAQISPGQVGWLTVIFIPLGLAYGLTVTLRGVALMLRHTHLDPPAAGRLAVIAFCTFNGLYIGIASILLSYGDHNRYRFSLMPLFLVLVASMCVDIVGFLKPRSTPTSSPSHHYKPRKRSAGLAPA